MLVANTIKTRVALGEASAVACSLQTGVVHVCTSIGVSVSNLFVTNAFEALAGYGVPVLGNKPVFTYDFNDRTDRLSARHTGFAAGLLDLVCLTGQPVTVDWLHDSDWTFGGVRVEVQELGETPDNHWLVSCAETWLENYLNENPIEFER